MSSSPQNDKSSAAASAPAVQIDVEQPIGTAAHEEEVQAAVVEATYRELIKHWFILGWVAFGGPAAHVGMFQKLFVDKLRWCTFGVFAELLALGQCMPGPTSTQMSFALGTLKGGLKGGAVSGAGPLFCLSVVTRVGLIHRDAWDRPLMSHHCTSIPSLQAPYSNSPAS
jgi:chromate transporter